MCVYTFYYFAKIRALSLIAINCEQKENAKTDETMSEKQN